ncbi:hypothetical protein [Muricoccus nepalensis]|uniref:hypothetical protein n=1 Tax=Muricoccus nepalensis TaxID=1854500 RepID=UPI00112BDDF5|nr:hypothetical protein [Roseomonas nepalensis]
MEADTTSCRDPGGRKPITPEAGAFYLAACDALLELANGRTPNADDLYHVSEAQGMFGRLFILGQPDRLAVEEALGAPSKQVAMASRKWLREVRAAIKANKDIQPLMVDRRGDDALNALDLAAERLRKAGFKPSPEPLRG